MSLLHSSKVRTYAMRLILTYDNIEDDDMVEFTNFVNIGTNVEIRTHTNTPHIHDNLRNPHFKENKYNYLPLNLK